MSGKFVRIIRIAVIVAWVVAGVDVSPWLFELDADASLFVVAAACVGSYVLISRANARPVAEVMNAGIEIGRRRALLEVESENVTSLPPRGASRLRVVSQR